VSHLDLKVKFLELPKNYLDFMTKYNSEKCDLCHDFGLIEGLSICLICGMKICTIKCFSHKNYEAMGNLSLHAL
jgi:hypothetical protein